MRFKRIFLLFPSFESDTGSSRPSPSIAYIAQSLEDNNIDYDILDMKLGYNQRNLRNRISEFNPDLVGVTIFTLHHITVYKIITDIKNKPARFKVIVGGPHVPI